MTTTILKVSQGARGREAVGRALREAGVGVIEVESWDQAAEALRDCEAALVVCDGELLDGVDSAALAQAITSLAGNKTKSRPALAPEVARTFSHELRTPLSAMAGWVHLMETGKLDADATKRALEKLRANIDDQVRTIDRYLGVTK